ncbi:MAG: phasin family protein [Sedimenticola sp.]|nr:phasin family protein [Sedimenticola sp.]
MKDPKANLDLIREFGINGYESVRSLAEINLRTWEKLVERQMDTFNLLLDTGIEQVSAAGNTQDVSQLLNNQVALGKALGENFASKSREAVDLATEAGNEYRNWLENGISTFNSKVTEAANEALKNS